MKLYSADRAPNPWRVRIFLAEKGIDVPRVEVDLMNGAARSSEFLSRNSLGEVPVLELDDGRVITESVAICRYFEALNPVPRLFGADPLDQATVEMWTRRMELHVVGAVANVALHTIPFFAGKVEQMPEFAATQRRALAKKWAWLDGELADGRPFVAGDRFTVADITGMMALRIGDYVEAPVADELAHVRRWEASVRARPSWNA
jgi:glutathione S-transferase